ncbi:MAG: serine/threonine-protein kinase [Acidobacteriia bacterium]|nr:serine/threonine-protein kinase [Terriglobia bacterium]
MRLVAGSQLDSYEILAPLGAGGMGEVYRARDASLKRDVAIKVLPDHWSRDPGRLHRFELEAQATAALNHPNIVSIFHVGQHDGCPYIVTELLQGETLRDRLRRGRMRPREACDCGIDIARGLAAAHDAGVVHRDLKPENLFLTKDERLKILDFGLAKLTQPEPAGADGATATLPQHTEPGHVSGTVGYMAPEQVRGHAADPRSDIFAFGVVLYEMLTGQRAFRKATSAETLSAILNEEPPPLAQSVQDLPPALQRILSRCLEKRPERRFQHASDLGFALEALSDASGAAIAAPPRAGARAPWIWIAAAVFAVAVAAALFVWWSQPAAVPVVEAVTQLTSDGEVKANSGRLETDGSRIYFGEGTLGSYRIMQVAATGGPTAIIPTRLANFQFTALSQDGSYLLGAEGDAFALPFWAVPLPSGEPRRLGSIVSQDADLFPDGRILFCLGNDINVAEKDGSQPRKLLTVDGLPVEPSVSPDGERLVFTIWSPAHRPISIDEAKADGSGLHVLLRNSAGGRLCCARWTPDGRYVVYQNRHEARTDLWVLPMQSGLLRRSPSPVQLTNGPLSYRSAVSSRDGKRIFAVGIEPRGELVRYDANSRQFLALLPAVPAFDPSWSANGKWVAYTTYPDHALWRSRSDGTDPLQLTFPPGQVFAPSISPDGMQVAYVNSAGAICLIGRDGGSPPAIVEKNGAWPHWSPDGSHLVFVDRGAIHLLDIRTGGTSLVPGPAGLLNPQWVGDDRLVAGTPDFTKLMTFDVRTQQWSDLASFTAPGYVVNWVHTPDYKSVDYITGGADPMLFRVRLADRKIETITSLKGLHRATGPGGNTEIGVAPDGSPVFTRDIGTQEIYALTVKWP